MGILDFKYSYIKDIRVLTKDAIQQGTENKSFGIIDLLNEIQRPEGIAQTDKIKSLFSEVIEGGGSIADAKKLIEPYKKSLPVFQLSGFQKYGHGKPSEQNPFLYNGCFQIDIDMKYKGGFEDAKELKELLPYDQNLMIKPVFIANSPTYGLKMLIATDSTDIENHSIIGKAIKLYMLDYFSTLIENFQDVGVDYCDPYKVCFVPYDSSPYISDKAVLYSSSWFLEYYELNKELIEPKKAKVEQNTVQKTYNSASTSDQNKCKYYFKNLCNQLIEAKEGERHSTRARVAFIAGGNAAAYDIDYGFALDWILRAALQNTTNTVQATKDIETQFSAGYDKPRK